MKEERRSKLLKLCAKDLLNCCSPLHRDFLVEHKVTAEECYDLSVTMGEAIDAYARFLEK